MSAPGVDISTKTVFPIDKSYLYFNFQCMTWLGKPLELCEDKPVMINNNNLGLWSPYRKGVKYRIYQIYTIWIMTVVLTMRTMSTFLRSLNADNKIFFIREFSLFAAEIAEIIKCIAFVVHRDQISELSTLFNWERHMLSGHEIQNHRDEVLGESLFASKTFTIVSMVSSVQYFVFYFYSALKLSEHEVDKLPMGSVPMKYLMISTQFWPVFTVDYLSASLLGIIALAQDGFLMGVMINIAAQLKILNFRLERCHTTQASSDAGHNEHLNLGIHFECVPQIHDQSVTFDANEEFINCIKFHQQIVRMLKLFHSIYTYVLLPQVFISLSMIILQLHLIMGKQDDGTDAIVAYLFLFAVLLQLLAFCWGGNFILVESERTIDSIYTSHWYNQDRVFRNNLKIFLGAVRKPLTASASSLIDLTAVTFKNILSKGYSGAAVLKNVN